MISEVEHQGVYRVRGGMTSLARALHGLCARLGVNVRCGAEVRRIEVARGRAVAVVLASGECIPADSVIVNADVAALAGGHFGEAARRAVSTPARRDRSLSAVTWALRAETSGFPLAHHSVFFSEDYAAEFAALGSRQVPGRPTVYACAQDRGAEPIAPGGPERLLLLVNAPATGDRDRPSSAEVDEWKRNTTSYKSN